jgi:tetratricopeptide (TPR) repeat protein
MLYKNYGDLRRDAEATNSVVLTWQITFEQIQKERRSAAKLLSFMSLFHPQEIPKWILRSYYTKRHEYGGNNYESNYHEGGENDDDSRELNELNDDIETLRDYSLVGLTAQLDAYEMHALVQLCTRVWLSSINNMEKWRHVFLRVISKEYPTEDHENWIKRQQLEPHIAPIIETEPVTVEEKGDWAQLLTNGGWYEWQMGRYNAAEKMLKKAVEIREKVLDKERKNTIQALGKMMLKKAVRIRKEILDKKRYNTLLTRGRDHPSTLTSVNNLAFVLGFQGKYEEAEQMHRRVLSRRGKNPNH